MDGTDGGALVHSLRRASTASGPASQRMPHWWRRRARAGAGVSISEDMLVESVVLTYIITECPEGVTIPALALRFNAKFEQGVAGSAVERAVRELVCDGRLQIRGGHVIPAWPGREFAQ